MTDTVVEINATFRTEEELYRAYMPFVTGGGLFIRTKTVYDIGTAVHLTVQLLDAPEVFETEGQVVWITPKGAQGNKPAGVGVQFVGENSRMICHAIETHLAGLLKSTQNTDTI